MSTLDRKASGFISQIEPVKPAYPNAYLGMILFLISELFLFGSLFWSYYYLRTQSQVWPPSGVDLTMTLASINTVVLLTSSLTIWWATRKIRQGSRNGLAIGLLITILLAGSFLGITIYEWLSETFRPWTHAYGSVFYTMTGFHALHVFGGIVLMVFLLIRTLRNCFTPQNYLPVEVGSLYWHFVDFIWLIVFTTLFIVR